MTLKRMLLTFAAIPAGVTCGFLLAIPVVGAPHAFPGLLMNAPEHVRNRVGLAVVLAMPVVLIYLVWHGVIWRAILGRAQVEVENRVHSMDVDYQESLIARFRQKSSDELKAVLATKGLSRYPDSTYQLVERVLKERGTR
jgi:hypothetical protein